MSVAADRQSHEDQEYSSPPVHCKCNDPGTFVFVSVLILAIIQDQALVASKHFLVETENEKLVDNAEGPSEAKLKSLPDQTDGSDYKCTWWTIPIWECIGDTIADTIG